ncbi:MAG: amidohydrolase family protein [Blastocatellia bacterium]
MLPGLMDMHAHLFSDDEFPDRLAGDEFAIMLANGVTTIRLMIGTPEQLTYRAKIANGEMFGPTLFIASPEFTERKGNGIFNGRVVTTPDEARAAVRECKGLGYDFIKLTTAISRPVYDAVIETAKEQDIRVVGHVDLQVGFTLYALTKVERNRHIEHLDSYMEALLRDDAPSKVGVSDMGVWRKPNWENLDYVDESKIAVLAQATAKTGTYTCPTLSFFKWNFVVPQSDDEIRARPDFRFYPKNSARALVRGTYALLDKSSDGGAPREISAHPQSTGQKHSRRGRQDYGGFGCARIVSGLRFCAAS